MPERGEAAEDLPQQALFRKPSGTVLAAIAACLSVTSTIVGIVMWLSTSHSSSKGLPSAHQLCIFRAQTAATDPLNDTGFGADPVPQDSFPGSAALRQAEQPNAVSAAEEQCAAQYPH